MTVDVYIWQQKEGLREVLDYVHHLLLQIAPEVQAAVKWNVPYYTLHQGLLYLNHIKTSDSAVEVCFTRGREFVRGKELLQFKDRKLVGGYTLGSLEQIDEDSLRRLIEEAIRLDSKLRENSPWKKHL